MDIESILAVKGRQVRTIRPDAKVAEAVRRMHAERVRSIRSIRVIRVRLFFRKPAGAAVLRQI